MVRKMDRSIIIFISRLIITLTFIIYYIVVYECNNYYVTVIKFIYCNKCCTIIFKYLSLCKTLCYHHAIIYLCRKGINMLNEKFVIYKVILVKTD